jgi:deoxyuridine 5'-triphosphate nucleotidohydrolase
VNNLEKYVMNITEPFDLLGNSTSPDNEIIIELMEDPSVNEWNPKVPEHASRNQHLNVGLDLFSAHTVNSTKHSENYHYAIIRTGIKLELPYGYHMMIASRSGLGFTKHIQAFPGIIDHSYRGEIMVKLYGPSEFTISSGDKIAQGLIFKSQEYMITLGTVDTNTERGEKGFGSTDTPEV